MKTTLYYFSTNTFLSYNISKLFYNSKFYVWCSTVFNPDKLSEYDIGKFTPPSSSPYKIYTGLKEEILGGDRHSAKIEQNRKGLLKGAGFALANNMINDEEFNVIKSMIEQADINSFRPLLYIIHADKVKGKIKMVPPNEKAHPLSEEYIIEDLKEDEFEIIEF